MSNTYINLPCPSANGAGASVDMSSFGKTKTLVVSGDLDGNVTIEVNNALVDTDGTWAPLTTFRSGGEISRACACRWMRARVSGYRSGDFQIDVGGTNAGTLFAMLDPTGAAVDTSALPIFKTIQVGGTFARPVIIEISTDGATDWAQVLSFAAGGIQNLEAAAKWMRVTGPGDPDAVVGVGAAEDVSGGGGTFGIPQAFSYTVTGAEPDLTSLAIVLPSSRASAAYQVQCTAQATTYAHPFNVISKTTVGFVLALYAQASPGDVFSFFVSNTF